MKDEIMGKIKEIVESLNAFFVDLEIHGSQKNPKIIVYADTMNGITIAECEKISREVQAYLDDTYGDSLNYQLEVSSPGIGRGLVFDWQYRKNIGREVRVIYLEDEVQKTIEGELENFVDNIVYIRLQKKLMEIPLEKIIKTKVILRW